MIEIKLKYFKNSEFDQPGSPGSWINMDLNLLILIDKIRHRCGIPLKINSAYRDPEYNKSIKERSNSFIHIDISEASNKPAKVAWLY